MSQDKRSPLKAARQRAGLSQCDLARRAACHPSTVSLAERGALSIEMAVKFGTILGVQPSDLFRQGEAQ